MSYDLKVISDHPVGFWKLDESSGTEILDYSGCNNTGTYYNYTFNRILPLVPGGDTGTKILGNSYLSFQIDRNYYSDQINPGFATKYNPTDNFSIEAWVYPGISSSSETPLFADVSSDTGIFYENGNIVFKVEGESVEYTLDNLNKSIHIVCVYSSNQISIFIDGRLKVSKNINNFKFTATSATFTSGPVIGESDYFIIDGIAVYRYALNAENIFNHYSEIYNVPAIQIAYPDNGSLFQFNRGAINRRFTYAYPEDKSWEDLAEGVLSYDSVNGYLGVSQGAESVSTSIKDVLAVPNIDGLPYSIIEWDGDNGVSIEISQDDITYVPCTNNMPLPLSDPSNGIIYIKINFDSSDSSRFLPKIYRLRVSFYDSLEIYSVNGPEIISPLDGALQLGFSMTNYPILTMDYRNGLRTIDGFNIYTDKDIYTIETFYTPKELNASSIISNLSWDASGILNKSGISAIYINGIDKSSATSIEDLFETNSLNHVIIVLSEPVTGNLEFNTPDNEALYQHLSVYEKQFDPDDALIHYNLYANIDTSIASGSSIGMSESSVNYYNNDWTIRQTV